jgi:hypothetical protein
MYGVELGPERLSQDVIRRRQQEEADRKQRFFAPKVRTMGVCFLPSIAVS